jgi:hypothetical protein
MLMPQEVTTLAFALPVVGDQLATTFDLHGGSLVRHSTKWSGIFAP